MSKNRCNYLCSCLQGLHSVDIGTQDSRELLGDDRIGKYTDYG